MSGCSYLMGWGHTDELMSAAQAALAMPGAKILIAPVWGAFIFSTCSRAALAAVPRRQVPGHPRLEHKRAFPSFQNLPSQETCRTRITASLLYRGLAIRSTLDDSSTQEFTGWGGGLVLEPSLKITFPGWKSGLGAALPSLITSMARY